MFIHKERYIIRREVTKIMEKEFDIIIVGARAAGASLAILLGRMGKRVVVIDKARFPSDTLSTHHMSHLHYLRELGVLQEVEKTGLRKITRMRTYIGESFVEGPRASYTLIPRRKHLDQILLEKALTYETVVLKEETFVSDLLWEEGQVTGVYTVNKQGESEQITADLVVGADGRNSAIANWVKAEEYHTERPLRPVFYGYYKGVQPLLEPATEIFLNEGRVGFLFPMEEGMDCLGLEIHPEEFKTFAEHPQQAFERTYRNLYQMDIRLKQAVLEGKMVFTPGVPNFFRQSFGSGWVLLGDAAHSKDPSTGLGINDAFMQSFMLADAIQRHDQGENWQELMNQFNENRDEQLMPGYQLTLDYVHSLRKWTTREKTIFQSIAANPMVWNKIVPLLPDYLKQISPELYGAAEAEAKDFGFEGE